MNRNIPVAVLWYQKGQVRKLGPQNIVKWLDSQNQAMLESLMQLDRESITNGDEPLVSGIDDDTISERILAQTLVKSNVKQLKRLPVPLSLMNKKEKMKYVSAQVYQEVREKDDPIRIVYGHPNCRPSFWPQEVWAWENCTTRLWKMNEELYTGPGTYIDFLTICIERLFQMHHEDPETYVEDLDDDKLKMRKAMRGLLVKDEVNEDATIFNAQIVDDPVNSDDNKAGNAVVLEHFKEHIEDVFSDESNAEVSQPKRFKKTNDDNSNNAPDKENPSAHVDCVKPNSAVNADLDKMVEEGKNEEDDNPVCITINTKGFEPIQIMMTKLKKARNETANHG